jgi:hypothetical protein
MKTLYHGSIEIIGQPEVRTPNRRLDFGVGFYLTSSIEQAKNWVVRRLSDSNTNQGYINIYTFDDIKASANLKIKQFEDATEEWLDFVMANRRDSNFTHDYDIVIGPVANDRVYTAFSLYEGGIISKTALIDELMTYRLVDQYVFHTPKALEYLKFNTANKV